MWTKFRRLSIYGYALTHLFYCCNGFFSNWGEEDSEAETITEEDEYFDQMYMTVSPGEKFHMPFSKEIQAGPLFESDKIFKKLALIDQCRALIADSLLANNDCHKFFENSNEDERKRWHMQFALRITNCHFSAHQRPEIECKFEKSNPEWCFKGLDRHYFEIYTQFSLATERICNEMNYDKWQRGIEDLITQLYKSSFQTLSHLQNLGEASQSIINKQDSILSKNNEIEKSISKTSRELHMRLTKQTSDLTQQLYISQEAIEKIFDKQAEISNLQNNSLHSIEESTLGISKMIDEQVIFQIDSVRNVSSNLDSLLKDNSYILEQHTGLIYRLTRDIDDAIEKWSPLMSKVATAVFKIHRFMRTWKFSFYYVGTTFTILLFTSFSIFSSVRYPALCVLLISYIVEELAFRWLGESTEGIFEQVRFSTGTVLFFIFCFRIIQAIIADNSDEGLEQLLRMEELVQEMQTLTNNFRGEESSKDELVPLLVDQLVQYRLEALQEKVDLNHITMKLRRYLQKQE